MRRTVGGAGFRCVSAAGLGLGSAGREHQIRMAARTSITRASPPRRNRAATSSAESPPPRSSDGGGTRGTTPGGKAEELLTGGDVGVGDGVGSELFVGGGVGEEVLVGGGVGLGVDVLVGVGVGTGLGVGVGVGGGVGLGVGDGAGLGVGVGGGNRVGDRVAVEAEGASVGASSVRAWGRASLELPLLADGSTSTFQPTLVSTTNETRPRRAALMSRLMLPRRPGQGFWNGNRCGCGPFLAYGQAPLTGAHPTYFNVLRHASKLRADSPSFNPCSG